MANISINFINLDKKIFQAEEIYNPQFASIYALLILITFIISICLSCLLIFVITKKTPLYMKNLKIYLIPYSIYTIVIELVWGLYTPMLLHPFVYFYPTGIAKYLPPNLSKIFVGFGAVSAILLLDCCIGIINERLFALRNIEKVTSKHSKIPFYFFCLSTFSCFVCFGVGVLFILNKYLSSIIYVPIENVSSIINSRIMGLDKLLNFDALLIFQGSDENTIPYFVISVGLFASFRVGIASFVVVFNGYKTYKLKYLMSHDLQKTNSMLLQMSYFHFLGYFVFLSSPVAIITFTYWFDPNPCLYVNYCLAFMNFFGIYDVCMTLICIKPYRIYFISLLKKIICKSVHYKTVVIPSLVL